MSLTTPLHVFFIVGEASGDALAAGLAQELIRRLGPQGVRFSGLAGEQLTGLGAQSLFPISDIAVMGVGPVLRRLPTILNRLRQTAQAAVANPPDIVISVDAPDFSLRVNKKIRAARPEIPIVHWVCPSVWAWRPGRAPKMRPHVDHLLTLLPFEPQALADLAGPPGTYVGHPLIERLHDLRPASEIEVAGRANHEAPEIVVLPGSRGSEITRLMPIFGEAIGLIQRALPAARFTLPAVKHLVTRIRAGAAAWPVAVDIVTGEEAKYAAFRRARAALAASGTVTLELALAGLPLAAAYRVSDWEAAIARRLVKVSTASLPNLILGQPVVPEFIQEKCTPEALAQEMIGLVGATPARAKQTNAFARLDQAMQLPGTTPSAAAADVVLAEIARLRR